MYELEKAKGNPLFVCEHTGVKKGLKLVEMGYKCVEENIKKIRKLVL